MNWRRNILIAGLASLALLQPGLARAEDGVTDTEVVIGMFGALSGPLSVNSLDAINAARAYYADVNAKGGVAGRKIRLVIEDEKCNPSEANAVVRKLITVDHVFALNGGSCSGVVVGVQELVNREKVPHVFVNASGDSAVFPPTHYQFGSFAGTQRSTMVAVLQFSIEQLKGKRLALIGPDDDMGRAATRFAKLVAAKYGAQIVTSESVPNNATDVTVPVLNARAAKPDVILLTTYTAPTILVLQKALEYGMDIPFVAAVQSVSSAPAAFAKAVGDDAALGKFYLASPLAAQPGSPALKPWYDMFAKTNPAITAPAQITPYGFVSAMAVTKALEAAGRDLTRDRFIAALEALDFDSGITVGRVQFGPTRRDAERGQVILKVDGKTVRQMPGTYEWDKVIPADDPAL